MSYTHTMSFIHFLSHSFSHSFNKAWPCTKHRARHGGTVATQTWFLPLKALQSGWETSDSRG